MYHAWRSRNHATVVGSGMCESFCCGSLEWVNRHCGILTPPFLAFSSKPSSGSRAGKLNTFLDSLAQGQKLPKMATLLVRLAAKVGGSNTHGWVLIPQAALWQGQRQQLP